MSRRRFAAAGLLMGVLLGVGWIVLQRSVPTIPADAAAPAAAPRHDDPIPATPFAAARAAAPAPALAVLDDGPAASGAAAGAGAEVAAFDAGVAFEDRQVDSARRVDSCRYGADIAALVRLPLAQAVPRLAELVRSGDGAAGGALAQRLLTCVDTTAIIGEWPGGNLQAVVAARRYDPVSAAFLRGVEQRRSELAKAEKLQCRDVEMDGDALRALLLERLRASGVDTERLDNDPESLTAERLTAAFPLTPRQRWECESSFGERPLDVPDDDARPHSWEWLALAATTVDRPRLSMALAECARTACRSLADLPDGLVGLLGDAPARLGNAPAIERLIADARSARDRRTELAWSWYLRWLLFNSCQPSVDIDRFATLGHDLVNLRNAATPAELGDAQVHYAALIQQSGTEALSLRGCGP